MSFQQTPTYLTVKQVAELLHVTEQTIMGSEEKMTGLVPSRPDWPAATDGRTEHPTPRKSDVARYVDSRCTSPDAGQVA